MARLLVFAFTAVLFTWATAAAQTADTTPQQQKAAVQERARTGEHAPGVTQPGNGPAGAAGDQKMDQKRDRIHMPETGKGDPQQPQANGKNGAQGKKGKKAGPGDGTGNQANGPKDGTGYGAKSGNRTGPLDGSGPGVNRGGGRAGGAAGGRGGRGGGGR